jgi:ADP-ribosylglycohydrolase
MAFDKNNSHAIKSFIKLPRSSIKSGGYVVDTLDASLWCLLNYDSYSDTVLAAVNLGGDTDTTAAVTGGLAGLYYSRKKDTSKSIPQEWIGSLANLPLLKDICDSLAEALNSIEVHREKQAGDSCCNNEESRMTAQMQLNLFGGTA